MFYNISIEYIESILETNISIIKTICLVLLIYYTNFKITNRKLTINYKYIFLVIIAIIYEVLKVRANYLVSTISLILMVSIIFSKNNLFTSIVATLTSIAINYIILIIVVTINFIFNIIIGMDNSYINLTFIILGHILLLKCFWKNKKFKYGISTINKNSTNEYMDVLILNISIITLFVIILLLNSNIDLLRDVVLGLIISIIFMFLSIQKSLQLYYKQKLLVQELKETKDKLEEKTKEVKELEEENIKISKKSHTLVHKQKSLEHKIEGMIGKAEISREEVGELTDRIKEINKDLYKEKTVIELDKTEISQIDDMLKYMQSECKKNNIDFELQIKGNIHHMTNNLISKEDLETLLADHIKNAIIAIKHGNNINRSILVRIGKIDECYGLYIYDSGIEFKKETLQNLGKKPSTTHANEGGTGMGFMNTFDTLKRCDASLIIEEYNEPSKDNYTKVIKIKFNNKNEFEIKTYREKSTI